MFDRWLGVREPHAKRLNCLVRLAHSSAYSGFNSIPIALRPSLRETTAVVPDPMNGSRTVPPSGQPALIHGSIRSSGNVAKCASGYDLVLISQTECLFLPIVPASIGSLSSVLQVLVPR